METECACAHVKENDMINSLDYLHSCFMFSNFLGNPYTDWLSLTWLSVEVWWSWTGPLFYHILDMNSENIIIYNEQ